MVNLFIDKNKNVTQLFIDLCVCHDFNIDPIVYFKDKINEENGEVLVK
jgi:hypothetical protein